MKVLSVLPSNAVPEIVAMCCDKDVTLNAEYCCTVYALLGQGGGTLTPCGLYCQISSQNAESLPI